MWQKKENWGKKVGSVMIGSRITLEECKRQVMGKSGVLWNAVLTTALMNSQSCDSEYDRHKMVPGSFLQWA